ncbi:MAG: hypothetical protein LUC17_03080 [Oscillospiraceae bacterium]|nr:hypothetical protein [Oscillospiraceae bacterium]
MEEKTFSNVFAIPANYTDSGRLLGGMLETRNAVEAAAVALVLGYLEFRLIPLGIVARIVIMTVTVLPAAIVAAMGIDGDSLFSYLGHILTYWRNRRVLHYRRIGYVEAGGPKK